MGNSTHYTYNELGLLNSIVDALENVWLSDYDERGNLTAAGFSGQKLWRYERDFATYDANGFLNALNLPNDEQILTGRDALSRETSC